MGAVLFLDIACKSDISVDHCSSVLSNSDFVCHPTKKVPSAYQWQDVQDDSLPDKFEFIGLHDISNIKNPLEYRGVLRRDDEIAHIEYVLETIIFPQSDVKQLFCLTGKSGCGKSTILSFFRNAYVNEYEFFDFSGDYNYLELKIETLLGSNPSEKIAQLTHDDKKVVIILDQFERYFYLTDERKQKIKKMITKFGRKNAAVIVSMREEYLASFLKEFDINNSHTSEEEILAKAKGMLKPLVSVVCEDKCFSYVQAPHNMQKTICWEGANIKNNIVPHLQCEDVLTRQNSKDLDITLFYVENQNELVCKNDENSKSLALKGRCQRAFGEDDGISFFDKHKHEPLIAQQIIYHMAEYDKKIRRFSNEDMRSIYEMDHQELMTRYFDVQLSASNNQFDCSRILYILSKARLHQITVKRTELETALFTQQFHSFGDQMFKEALQSLVKFQLIRKHTENSDEEYEIAHDFVATEFLNYSNSNMDFNVRGALDIFMADFLNHKASASEMSVNSPENRISKKRFYKTVNHLALAMLVVIDLVYRFIYNPWTAVPELIQLNPFGDYFPLFTLTGTWVAVLYLGQIYDKIIKYYQGSRKKLCHIIYIPLICFAICALACYPHILMFDGISIAILGLNCTFLLDKKYHETSRARLRSYGLKCTMMGILFLSCHLLLMQFNSIFPEYLIILELIVSAVLVYYSHMTHLTKEYLYARLIDVSSIKNKIGG